MIHFSKLLNLGFWFAIKPSPLGEKTVLIMAIGFLAIVAVAILFKFIARTKKKNPPQIKLLKKLSRMFSTMALVGLVLLFFSYEQIYILGSHFWFLVWLLGLLVWAVFILIYAVRKMPREKEEFAKRQRFLKYLPH